jgi:anaerobic selenocysteine-containing dehydrogenase
MTSVIHGYCTLCHSRCGTLNKVDSDRLLSVEPDPSHPTGKAMWMTGRAAPEIVHSPHRVFYPMRRTTPNSPWCKSLFVDSILNESTPAKA